MEQFEPINRVVLPGHHPADSPAVPDEFRAMLRRYDPDLLVSWNYVKQRFVIEQCVGHHGPGEGRHTHLCERNYVVIVEDEDGGMAPLGEHVIGMIARRDVTKHGYGPNDLARFQRETRQAGLDERARRERKGDEEIKYASRYNRRQLMRAIHMMQQMGTPNK